MLENEYENEISYLTEKNKKDFIKFKKLCENNLIFDGVEFIPKTNEFILKEDSDFSLTILYKFIISQNYLVAVIFFKKEIIRFL
jgi:hypothetical protein